MLRGKERLEEKDILEAFAQISPEQDKGLYGQVCYYAACRAMAVGRQNSAVHYLTQAIRYLEDSQEVKYLCKCYNKLGVIAHRQNNLVVAMEQYDAALACAQRCGEEWESCVITGNIADIYYRMGDYESAIKRYDACIAQFEKLDEKEIKNPHQYFSICSCRGCCMVFAGRIEEADWEAERLKCMLDERENDLLSVLSIHIFLALLREQLGWEEDAERYMDKILRLVKENGRMVRQFDSLMNIIDLFIRTGRFGMLESLLDFLEPELNDGENEGLLLQLLQCRLEYCGEHMGQEEFVRCSQHFFALKQKNEEVENSEALRMMELRSRLRVIRQERQELHEENARLLFKSRHDKLTGLPNRGYLNHYLEKTFDEATHRREPLGILFVDVDYFKELNDCYGHQKGDECIAAVAAAVRETAGRRFASRYGGDEFVVVIKNPGSGETGDMAERISSGVRKLQIPNAKSGVGPYVTVTIGAVSAVPKKTNKVWDFLAAADMTLYRQKQEKKGLVRCLNKLGG